MKHTEIDIKQIKENIFTTIGDEWMLITGGNINDFNTMTASWGGLGVLWFKNVATCYVRPQRYTFNYMENSKVFTLSFFSGEYKDVLKFCGTNSGSDTDKVKETGLIPMPTKNGGVAFEQARLVLECKKLYTDFFKPENFVDKGLPEKIYKANDFHKMYVGEITSALVV